MLCSLALRLYAYINKQECQYTASHYCTEPVCSQLTVACNYCIHRTEGAVVCAFPLSSEISAVCAVVSEQSRCFLEYSLLLLIGGRNLISLCLFSIRRDVSSPFPAATGRNWRILSIASVNSVVQTFFGTAFLLGLELSLSGLVAC